MGTQAGEERVWFSIKAPLRNSQGAVTGLVGVSVVKYVPVLSEPFGIEQLKATLRRALAKPA